MTLAWGGQDGRTVGTTTLFHVLDPKVQCSDFFFYKKWDTNFADSFLFNTQYLAKCLVAHVLIKKNFCISKCAGEGMKTRTARGGSGTVSVPLG